MSLALLSFVARKVWTAGVMTGWLLNCGDGCFGDWSFVVIFWLSTFGMP